MSIPSSDGPSLSRPPPTDAGLPDLPSESAEDAAAEEARRVDGPGVLLGLSFVAFLIAYAVSGQRAAGIAFWTVMLGLPALYVVVAALGTAWTRGRSDELLRVATLAVSMAQQQRSDVVDEERE
jgi:hypothetical protein